MKKYIFILSILFVFSSCKDNEKVPKINSSDYEVYLTSENKSFLKAKETNEFWSKRIDEDTTGVGDLAPLAGSYTALFETTGNIDALLHAETLLRRGMEISANGKDGFARGLARNYISQHRFKEAELLLEESYAGVSKKDDTELMLFDVYMEVGAYDKAKKMLEKVKDIKDYNYLIRLSKWSDYKGNLDAAIKYMEQAKNIADSRDSKSLKIWTYSNLGDYYGHAGRIEDSYKMYLNTLKMQPDNAYVKKGIAWIQYSANKNIVEANRILETIMNYHASPDYYLLKAEMAEFENISEEKESNIDKFLTTVSNPKYGAMYNAYLIEIYADRNPLKALELAEIEVQNRPTPEAFHLLALAQLSNKMNDEALATIINNVEGKTAEPMALYHAALVYKANGQNEKVRNLKEELLDAWYEIGPVLTLNVKNL